MEVQITSHEISSADEVGSHSEAAVSPLERLSHILRLIGVVALVGSAVTFLVQQWDDLDYVWRYLAFLTLTSVIGTTSFFCGVRLGDKKGARLLMAVVLLLTPVHFAQLGGFLFNSLQVPLMGVPALFHWSGTTPSIALLLTGVSLLFLTPLCMAAFVTLSRPLARRMTGLFLAFNAVLLLPIRDPGLIALFIGCATFAHLFFEAVHGPKQLSWHTLETRLSRLALCLPILLLFLRNGTLHSSSSTLDAAMLCWLGLGSLHLGLNELQGAALRSLAQRCGALLVTGAMVLFVDPLVAHAAREWVVPLRVLPAVGTMMILSTLLEHGGQGLRTTAMAVLALSGLHALKNGEGWISSLYCILSGLIPLVAAFVARRRSMFWIGAFTASVGAFSHIGYAARLYAISPWLSLALLGLIAVLSAALLEKYRAEVRRYLTALQKHYGGWDF